MTQQRLTALALLMLLANLHAVAQKPIATLPTRGFCIAAPQPAHVDAFVKFINEELAPRQVNVLILRVDFNYQFEKHPELRDSVALSKADVKKLVKACKDHGIRLIPQINLLGHQSWAGTIYNLLRVYPQFDETPHVKMPAKYVWPNADGLYCKSYCPLHPDLHAVVFSMIDEICDAFESTAFHAGMDEVFYLGDDKCPRCGGRDKAELYAGEVRTLRDHLHEKNHELWMWGDRLLEGKVSGLGMWEASYNNTHRAIDLIPKDVMICDWHYERADKTAVIFANKGFKVATCPWRNAQIGAAQVADMVTFRRDATPEVKENYQGIIQTVWSDAESFLRGYYAKKDDAKAKEENTPWNCFRTLFTK